MLFRKPRTPCDELIDQCLLELEDSHPTDPEYATILQKLERLYALKAQDRPEKFSRNTLLTVAANLAGILIVVGYEQRNVITSKAWLNLVKLKP